MKFSGKIGFYEGTEEVKRSVFKPKIIEKDYTGDILENNRRFQSTEYQNDTLSLNNQISILSDLYLRQNYDSIRYVLWNGVKWEVSNVNVGYPRLTLTLGRVYNG